MIFGVGWLVMKYNDRRGHRILRLSSRKHHVPKPKHSISLPTSFPLSIPLNVNELKVSLPLDLITISFKVSFPCSAYTDTLLESIDHLHDRILCSEELPSGIDLLVYIFLSCFNLGWMFAMENKSLSIFHFHLSDQGLEYTFAVTIEQNFSWIVYYQGQLVNHEYCMLLKKLPSKINSGLYT